MAGIFSIYLRPISMGVRSPNWKENLSKHWIFSDRTLRHKHSLQNCTLHDPAHSQNKARALVPYAKFNLLQDTDTKYGEFCQRREKSTQSNSSRQVVESKSKSSGEITIGHKVAQAGKDATYTGIVIVGLGVTGLMFYFIGRELFSNQSPSGVYSQAFKKCINNQELVDTLGEPVKGHGEMNRRGRRRHVRHDEYEREGVRYMRMRFYLEGTHNKGTAQLEVKKGDSGKWEFRYLFVEVDNLSRRTIVIEDNR